MKKTLKKLKEKSGFVSLETIVVAGTIMALAVYACYHFTVAGTVSTDFSIDKINDVLVALP